MKGALCAFLVLALSCLQVDGDESPGLADLYTSYVKDVFQSMSTELSDSVSQLKSKGDSSVQKGEKLIDNTVSAGLTEVQSLSTPECVSPAVDKLQKIKINDLYDFFHCDNMTDALAEFGAVVADGIRLGATLEASLSEIITNITSCTSWNPLSAADCFFKTMSRVQKEIKADEDLIDAYKHKASELIASIEENVEYCMHHNSLTSLDRDVKHVVNQAFDCQDQHSKSIFSDIL